MKEEVFIIRMTFSHERKGQIHPTIKLSLFGNITKQNNMYLFLGGGLQGTQSYSSCATV